MLRSICEENIRATAKDEHAKRELATTERMRELRPRLADVLAGTARPNTPAETIGFAELCALDCYKQYDVRFTNVSSIPPQEIWSML